MLSLIPAGSTIERVYYRVPGHYGYGDDFDNWDDAVRDAQAKRTALVESLTATMGRYASQEEIERTADVQTVVDLRWVIKYPSGHRVSSTDTVVERTGDVMKLRTSDEIGARA